ncbi:hypothetical protein ACF09H_29480 [Streptomyces sp. NPDC014983]|uniref:hypothetical protein n=1 Tax=Streptomyces sp. NPDC014983 TaxID=3364933 RepID=UPI0036FD014A
MHDASSPDHEQAADQPRANVPRTAAEWREALRRDELPPELAELPLYKRRRARRYWRSARAQERAQWIRNERRNTPTPLTIPILALAVAGIVAVAAWLTSDHHSHRPQAAHTTSPTVQQPTEHEPLPGPTSSSAASPTSPDAVAKAFVTAYSTRYPRTDQTHDAAVDRAAPYASLPLVTNLKKYDDKDFDQLVAAQAVEAKPTQVTISPPGSKQRPSADTSVRVWRQADITIAVTGTDDYSYTRHLTLEVTRADAASPWMITRILGIQE